MLWLIPFPIQCSEALSRSSYAEFFLVSGKEGRHVAVQTGANSFPRGAGEEDKGNREDIDYGHWKIVAVRG